MLWNRNQYNTWQHSCIPPPRRRFQKISGWQGFFGALAWTSCPTSCAESSCPSHVSLPGLSQASGCVTSTSYLPFVHWSPNLESPLRSFCSLPYGPCSSRQATALSHLWSALGKPYWPPAPKQGPAAEKQRNPSHHLAASLGLLNRYGQELHIVFSALTHDILAWFTSPVWNIMLHMIAIWRYLEYHRIFLRQPHFIDFYSSTPILTHFRITLLGATAGATAASGPKPHIADMRCAWVKNVKN